MWEFYSEIHNLQLDCVHETVIRCRFSFSASFLISGNATLCVCGENISRIATELNGVKVHADEELSTKVRVGMSIDSQKFVITGVRWDFHWHELASIDVSTTASDACFIENLSIVARKVNSSADHANEKILAAVATTTRSEEFFSAIDFLGKCWCAGECNQG